jgi:RNA polymerase sigma factor (TIGR02999 family)
VRRCGVQVTASLPSCLRPICRPVRSGGDSELALLFCLPEAYHQVVNPAPAPDITGLIRAWRAGDNSALEELIPIVYQELRQTARHYMRLERPEHTLQPTALIHEAFLRLAGLNRIELRDRTHFFALAARMMRRVLVDYARSRGYHKRGAGAAPLALDEARLASPDRDPQILELDEALDRLARQDPRKAQAVELRFFGGFSVEETAEALGVSPQTVLRDWAFVKAWLMREMGRGPEGRSGGC